MFYCEAQDKDGIPRAWGEGKTKQEAETQCRWAAMQKCHQGKRWDMCDFTFVHDAERVA